MTARDAMEELLGIQLDGMGTGYIKLILVEIAWHNYQETCKLHESSERQEQLKRTIICCLDTLVAQGCARDMAGVWGKGKWKAEESGSDSYEQLV